MHEAIAGRVRRTSGLDGRSRSHVLAVGRARGDRCRAPGTPSRGPSWWSSSRRSSSTSRSCSARSIGSVGSPPRPFASAAGAPEVVRSRLLLAESATNRRRVAQHAGARAVLPAGEREMDRWLAAPCRPDCGADVPVIDPRAHGPYEFAPVRRVRKARHRGSGLRDAESRGGSPRTSRRVAQGQGRSRATPVLGVLATRSASRHIAERRERPSGGGRAGAERRETAHPAWTSCIGRVTDEFARIRASSPDLGIQRSSQQHACSIYCSSRPPGHPTPGAVHNHSTRGGQPAPRAVDESGAIVDADRPSVDGPERQRATTCSGPPPIATTTSCVSVLTAGPARQYRLPVARSSPSSLNRPPRDLPGPPPGSPRVPQSDLRPTTRPDAGGSSRSYRTAPPSGRPAARGSAGPTRRCGSRRGAPGAAPGANGTVTEKAKPARRPSPARMRRRTRCPEPRARPFP